MHCILIDTAIVTSIPVQEISHDLCSHDSILIQGVLFHAAHTSDTIIYTDVSGCDSAFVIDLNLLVPGVGHREETTCDPSQVQETIFHFGCGSVLIINTVLEKIAVAARM